MRKSILISGKRDPDLVALYWKVGRVEFAHMVRDALRMIVRKGYVPSTKLPDGFTLQGNLDNGNVKFDLVLTSEKDEDVRMLLSHILPKELGAFVKAALRFYLGPVVTLQAYLDGEFSEELQKNPVPVQVFSIGIQESAPKRKKTRKQKTQAPRPVRKGMSSTQKPIPEQTPIVEKIPDFVCETAEAPTAVFSASSGTDEADEMLAMLESLL